MKEEEKKLWCWSLFVGGDVKDVVEIDGTRKKELMTEDPA